MESQSVQASDPGEGHVLPSVIVPASPRAPRVGHHLPDCDSCGVESGGFLRIAGANVCAHCAPPVEVPGWVRAE